jgi:hypothetical protein
LKPSGKIAEYIDALLSSDRFRGQVAHHSVLPPQAAHWADPVDPWPPPLAAALRAVGIERLYSHQAQAVDLVRAGRHCVVATPTASGKSLVYNLPFFEKVGRDPTSRALYLFPIKTLAQDQLLAFRELAAALGGDGLQALRWWKEGRIREIIDYCRSDVRITRELFLLGRRQGHLLFHNKAGQTVRVPVDWRRFAVVSDSGPAACDLEKEPQ